MALTEKLLDYKSVHVINGTKISCEGAEESLTRPPLQLLYCAVVFTAHSQRVLAFQQFQDLENTVENNLKTNSYFSRHVEAGSQLHFTCERCDASDQEDSLDVTIFKDFFQAN